MCGKGTGDMSCGEIQAFMDGFVDGELDLMHSAEIDRHLQDCQVCAAMHNGRLAMRSAVRVGDLQYVAPETLRKRIRTSIQSLDSENRRAQPRRLQMRWLAVSAAAAIIVVISALRMRPMPNPL